MNHVVKIKATKHNVATLTKRGLFSDDSAMFFLLYEYILSGKDFEFIAQYNEQFLLEIESVNLKY